MISKAEFSIDKYVFDKVSIDLTNQKSFDLNVDFKTKGVYYKDNSTFDLTFNFLAFNDNLKEAPIVSIQCVGTFKFENVTTFEDIPKFFYKNAIAILFPFVRAFVSMVTIQANISPIMLPTMNLSALDEPLRQNTIQQ